MRSQRHRRQRGQSLVETGIMIIIVFTVVLWVFELCLLMYTYVTLADAANEGVRYAIVHTGDNTGTVNVVKSFASASLHDTSAISVTVGCPPPSGTCTAGADPPDLVQVNVSYAYMPWFQMFTSPTMTAHAEGRIVR